jgi:hypothetical protein
MPPLEIEAMNFLRYNGQYPEMYRSRSDIPFRSSFQLYVNRLGADGIAVVVNGREITFASSKIPINS